MRRRWAMRKSTQLQLSPRLLSRRCFWPGCGELVGIRFHIPDSIRNTQLRAWVQEMATLCQPDQIHWCDGSQEEYDTLCDRLVQSGTFIKLNEAKRPNSFLAHSNPSDVVRG